jgi:hypothetical protein
MKFIGQLLAHHFRRYPRMELVDVYKLLHQAAMGPGHAIDDLKSVRDKLEAEVAQLGEGPDDPIADPISPDGKLARVHLRPYLAAGHSARFLVDAFVQTGHSRPEAPERLEKFCACLGDLAATGGIPFPRDEVERCVTRMCTAPRISRLTAWWRWTCCPHCTGSRRFRIDVRDAPQTCGCTRQEQAMNTPLAPRLKLPTRLLVIDAIGMVLAGIGVAGLFTELSGPLAFMANKHIAGVTAGVGFALMTFALGNIFRWHNRMRAQQATQTRQGSGP